MIDLAIIVITALKLLRIRSQVIIESGNRTLLYMVIPIGCNI